MEETRSFGYLCPKCGKPVIAQRTRFALTAAAARIECECEKSDLRVETDGYRFRLWVPCGLCGKTHQAECSSEALLEGRGIGLACPETKQLCCYVGQEQQVMQQMEELAIRAEKEKSEDPESFTDNIIMYEVLSELKDIAARAKELDAMGLDYICVHTATDVQKTGKNPLSELETLVSVLKQAKPAVAGGISEKTIAAAVRTGADIVVVGSALTKAADLHAAAESLLAAARA